MVSAIRIVGAFCFGVMCSACVSFSSRSGLVIADVTVVSPERASPLNHAYVRIVDGRIVEVAGHRLRGDVEIEGVGRYLVPGLIDSHVHLAVRPGFPSAMSAVQAEANPNVLDAALTQDPKSYLFFGFTTVIDLVGNANRTAQWNALDLRPDAYFCGATIIVGGRIYSAPYPNFSYKATLRERMVSAPDPAENTADAVVRRIADEGAICVKTIYDPYANATPTAEEGKQLVAAAHARRLPVFVHANRKRGQAFAVAAGADVIAHGMWRDRDEGIALDEEARKILSTIAQRGMGYQPTTQVIVGELDMLNDAYFARPGVADAYSSEFTNWCLRERNNCGAARFRQGSQERLKGTIERATEVTHLLAEANANLLFGSDTPSDALYTNPPGLNGRLEMNNWIAAGVTNEKLFRALTIDNAKALRLDDKIGSVTPGKTANLLLLRENPLDSVSAFDTIETVILHGRPIARAELSARTHTPDTRPIAATVSGRP